MDEGEDDSDRDDTIDSTAISYLSASEDEGTLHEAANRLQWSNKPFVNSGRARSESIRRENPGPKRVIHYLNEREAFLLFVDNITYDAVRFTNLQSRCLVQKFNGGGRRRKKLGAEVSVTTLKK